MYAQFRTLLNMYTWNVPPGHSPFQISKYATSQALRTLLLLLLLLLLLSDFEKFPKALSTQPIVVELHTDI